MPASWETSVPSKSRRFEIGFQIFGVEAAEKGGEVAPRRNARILVDHQELLLAFGPCRPAGQSRRIRVAGLCEIGPINLDQIRERRIIGRRWQPQPFAVPQAAEHIWNFQAVERAEFGFAPNWDPPVTFNVATTFTASNSFFGTDPDVGQFKEVDVLGTGAGVTIGSSSGSSSPPPPPQWTKVANEGDIVNVPAGTTVRFGFGQNWDPSVTFNAATTFTASNTFFGGDPFPYQVKEVDVLGTSAGITTGTQ